MAPSSMGWVSPLSDHVLLQPQLAFFRERFPNMPEQKFNAIFNRYAHIIPVVGGEPSVPHADVIRIPIEPFRADR